MRANSGKARVVLLLILGFLVNASAGASVWWNLTEIDRQLEDLEHHRADWDYLAAYADHPRVQAPLDAL